MRSARIEEVAGPGNVDRDDVRERIWPYRHELRLESFVVKHCGDGGSEEGQRAEWCRDAEADGIVRVQASARQRLLGLGPSAVRVAFRAFEPQALDHGLFRWVRASLRFPVSRGGRSIRTRRRRKLGSLRGQRASAVQRDQTSRSCAQRCMRWHRQRHHRRRRRGLRRPGLRRYGCCVHQCGTKKRWEVRVCGVRWEIGGGRIYVILK